MIARGRALDFLQGWLIDVQGYLGQGLPPRARLLQDNGVDKYMASILGSVLPSRGPQERLPQRGFDEPKMTVTSEEPYLVTPALGGDGEVRKGYTKTL